MKLIDLLVQHLGSNGGWPIGAGVCAQDNDGEVCFYTEKGIHRRNGWTVWSIPEGVQSKLVKRRIFFIPAEDMVTSVVCREQYEAALAASEQVVWNGEGLPPVGCECEAAQPGQINWTGFRVVAVNAGAIFGFWDNGVPSALDSDRWLFRPTRSETQIRREDSIQAIASFAITYQDAAEIYDAISAGKIPHITLN